jgi:predicted metalloprotease with PDZ domain
MQPLPQILDVARLLRGIPLLGCAPGSPSFEAGFRYGDILLSINDQPTEDVRTYLLARSDAGRPVRAVVFRLGATWEVTLPPGEAAPPVFEAARRGLAAALESEPPPPPSAPN